MTNNNSTLNSIFTSVKDIKNPVTKNLKPANNGYIFELAENGKEAELEAGPYEIPLNFNEVLMSANVFFTGKGSFNLQVKVLEDGIWSDYFSYGTFSTEKSASADTQENDFGKLDIDILQLKKPAQALAFKLKIQSEKNAFVKLISFTASDINQKYEYTPASKNEKPILLKVKPISQMIQPTDKAKRICGPVNCVMALDHIGIKAQLLPLIDITYDNRADLCGNWFLNTAGAGTYGAYAFCARINSLEKVKKMVESGVPVCASISFSEGELTNSPIPKSAGHFILIKGFTAAGDIIANESAAPCTETVERIYKREEIFNIWLKRKRGMCYIITDKLPDKSFL